jgi:hypothetical protein
MSVPSKISCPDSHIKNAMLFKNETLLPIIMRFITNKKIAGQQRF